MENLIRNELFKLKDDKYKEFHSSLCPGVDNIIGVRVPVLRKYAKELAKNNWKGTILIITDGEEIKIQSIKTDTNG